MSRNKETRELVRRVEKQGWRVEQRKDGWMCYSPDGKTMVLIHRTPSDRRGLQNTIARLRKGGFDPNA